MSDSESTPSSLYKPWQTAIIIVCRRNGHPWHVLDHWVDVLGSRKVVTICGKRLSQRLLQRYVHKVPPSRTKVCKECKSLYAAGKLSTEDVT